MRRWLAVVALAALLPGCGLFGSRHPIAVSARPGTTQTGIASWYGPGFHGNATASGEIFDQEDLTAAHQTLPLGTRVMITNLDNDRTVEVRINDRGPFVDDRIVDLSYAAARAVTMIGPGTARVRLEVLGGSRPRSAPSVYSIQLASFADVHKAERMRAELERRFAHVRVATLDAGAERYYRVRVGRFARRADAAELAMRSLVPLGIPIVIVQDGEAP